MSAAGTLQRRQGDADSAALARFLGAGDPIPTFSCAFCPRQGDVALNGKAVCRVCLTRLVRRVPK